MSPETLFVLGYVAWLLCFSAYIWPRLKAMDRIEAQRVCRYSAPASVDLLPIRCHHRLPNLYAQSNLWSRENTKLVYLVYRVTKGEPACTIEQPTAHGVAKPSCPLYR